MRDEVVHAGLEDLVVDRDPGGQVRELALEHGLDGGVLVLGVVDQEGDDVADVAGQPGAGDAEARVEAGRLGGHREQLGADGLVDVAVEVEGDRGEGRGGQIDEGHGGSPRVAHRSAGGPPGVDPTLKDPRNARS